jgi:hypothetical protein
VAIGELCRHTPNTVRSGQFSCSSTLRDGNEIDSTFLPPIGWDPYQVRVTLGRRLARRSLFQQGVEAGLGDGFVDFRFGAAGSDATQCFAVNLDGEAALVGEKFGEGQAFGVAFLNEIGGILAWRAVEGGVARFLLGPLQGVERGGISLLEKEKITAFVDDHDGHAYVALFGFGFGASDHDFDGRKVEIFLGWEIVGEGCSGGEERQYGEKDSFHARMLPTAASVCQREKPDDRQNR